MDIWSEQHGPPFLCRPRALHPVIDNYVMLHVDLEADPV